MTVDRKGRPLGIVEGVPNLIRNADVNVTLFLIPEWARELRRTNWFPEKVVIAEPLSYCAGVDRAIIAADKLLEEKGPGGKIYFYHAPIHNQRKVKDWIEKGALIVDSLNEVPDGKTVLASAHGVGLSFWLQAEQKHLRVVDATCPLVDKTHKEIVRFTEEGYKTILVGKKDHDEIIGTVDYAPNDIVVIPPNIEREELDKVIDDLKGIPKLALSAQTTLTFGDLSNLISYVQSKRPGLRLPNHDDVCYATQNRQDAVIEAIEKAGVDVMIIFGSDESKGRYRSNNTIELRDMTNRNGAKGYIAEDISEIKPDWLVGAKRWGVSAGASVDPARVAEFLFALSKIGLREDQIQRVIVVYEDQNFAPAKVTDFRYLLDSRN